VDEQTGKLTGMYSQVDPNYPMVQWANWSTNGKLLYYQIDIGSLDDKDDVLLIHSEETGQTREINTKQKLPLWYRPILSPDGQRFAVTGGDGKMNFGIFTIDSESGDVNQLVKIPVENEPVDPCQNWSPDGKAIFYKVRSPEQSEEFIIKRKDLTTGQEKDIYRGMHTREMKISPDGTRFAYFRNDMQQKSYVVGIMDIQSGKEMELWRVPEGDAPGGIWGTTWTPDGKYVLVDRSLNRGTELWRFPTSGGPGEKLHFFPEESWEFIMHPDGKRIVFMQNRNNNELWVLENFLPK
jgi:Tol biopolymer transport system component